MPWLPLAADTQVIRSKSLNEPLRDVEARELGKYVNALEEILGEAVEPLHELVREWRGDPLDLVARIQREALSMRRGLARDIRDAAMPYAQVMADAGARAAIEAMPDFPEKEDMLMFDEANPLAVEAAQAAAERMSQSVSDNTAQKIADAVSEGIDEGDTTAQIAERIAESRGISRERAEMIARTESAYAYTEGRLQAWKETGIVTGKKWLLSPDACEFCEAAARQYGDKAIPLDKPFYEVGTTLQGTRGGSMRLTYRNVDGPPLHPNCRCDTIASTEKPQES